MDTFQNILLAAIFIAVCILNRNLNQKAHKIMATLQERFDADRMVSRPNVVCLCGSTRFYEAFQRANFEETGQGRIVLSVAFYPYGQQHGEGVGITSAQKLALDELHKRRIDLADEILVLNVNGYVGDSTRSELEYAIAKGKTVRWLEPQAANVGSERRRE